MVTENNHCVFVQLSASVTQSGVVFFLRETDRQSECSVRIQVRGGNRFPDWDFEPFNASKGRGPQERRVLHRPVFLEGDGQVLSLGDYQTTGAIKAEWFSPPDSDATLRVEIVDERLFNLYEVKYGIVTTGYWADLKFVADDLEGDIVTSQREIGFGTLSELVSVRNSFRAANQLSVVLASVLLGVFISTLFELLFLSRVRRMIAIANAGGKDS